MTEKTEKKNPIVKFLEEWGMYTIIMALGVPIGTSVAPDKMVQALIVIGTVILTALIATLLVPFAGFSLNEGWQKFAVQYGAIPTFGTYAALLYRWAGWPAMLLVLPPLIVHAGYWKSSMHSRQYRLDLYKLGFAERMPHTTKLIIVLSELKMQHLANDIIEGLIAGKLVELTAIKLVLPTWDYLLGCVGAEIASEYRTSGLNPKLASQFEAAEEG